MSRLLYPKGPFLVLFTILLLSQGQIGFAQDEEELSGDSEPVEDATLDDSNAPEPAEEVVDDAPMDEAPMDEAPVDEAEKKSDRFRFSCDQSDSKHHDCQYFEGLDRANFKNLMGSIDNIADHC